MASESKSISSENQFSMEFSDGSDEFTLDFQSSTSISLPEQKKDSLEWLDKLFPDRESLKAELDNEDVITKRESDLRIIWFLVTLSLCLVFGILSEIVGIEIFSIPHVPRIVQPFIPQNNLLRYVFMSPKNATIS